MLKSDVIWPDSRRFKSGTQWEPVCFFSECLCNATSFDLMLGFFSSSAISVLCDGFATFLYNGGRMRLIINDILTEQDKAAVQAGLSCTQLPAFNIDDLAAMQQTLSEQDRHFFDCLSWLIANRRIDIKVIAPLGDGISHTKCGVFKDVTNKVSFDGSCNFSRTALVENIESITCACDWDGGPSKATIAEIEHDFEQIFTGVDTHVRYIDAEHIKTSITNTFKTKEIKSLLDDEYRLLQNKDTGIGSPTVRLALKRARKRVSELIEKINQDNRVAQEALREPKFPYPSGPREYQQQAFESWKRNNQKGLFAMATGTGKTITSLNCLLEIYKRLGYYKAIILVPTITLVGQWEEECRKFNFRNIVKVCSNNANWRQQVDAIAFNEQVNLEGGKFSYIIISTYASYSKANIAQRLNVFPRKQVLLIADEAHNMGSGLLVNRLKTIPYLRRIGLSATPERQYDEDVNEKLFNFFGCEENYTFEYSMQDAIRKGVLCRYYYYPHLVKLTPNEMDEYLKISTKLAKYYTYNGEIFRPKDDPILTALLLKRKQIIHKAANKLEAFKNILERRLREKGNLKYTLVYVPEGNKPDEDADIYDLTDDIEETANDIHLIDRYTAAVRNTRPTTTVRQFTSSTAERDSMLADFAQGKLEVLTSMKCLDEGVDVPRSELAIFCASTGNPRQFIQRRGRILRTHPDKHTAEIHDLVVVPQLAQTLSSYKMERSLLESELRRVHNFSILSENMNDTIQELQDILNYYNLSIFKY